MAVGLGGRRAVLVLLTVVELMVFLDTTVVNVALPAIGAALVLGETGLAWVTNAYQLAFGGFMLFGGRAADLLGRRRVFLAGLGLFTLASLMAGLAPTAWMLILARALQGLGAAVVVPAEVSLLAVTFTEPAEYRTAFGIWSAMGAAGAAAGTAAGGVLTQELGWPAIFLINVPIGLAALAVAPRLLTADGDRRRSRRPGGLDVSGAVTGTVALLLLGYGLGAITEPHRQIPAWGAVAAGLALGAVFLRVEARAANPLMPLRLYAVRDVTGSAVANFLVGAAHVPAFVLLSLYLQNTQHDSAIAAGLAVLPVALVNIAVSRTLIPVMLARFGARTVLAAGLFLQAVAMVWFARLPDHAHYLVDVLPAAVVFGIGLPAAFVGVTVPAVTAVAPADTGIAAGVVNTTQRVGSGLGVAVLLTLAATWTAHTTSYPAGIRVAFLGAACFALLGVVATLTIIRADTSAAAGRPPNRPAGGATDRAPAPRRDGPR